MRRGFVVLISVVALGMCMLYGIVLLDDSRGCISNRDRREEHERLAYEHEVAGRYALAIREYRLMGKFGAHESETGMAIGACYEALGEYENALAVMERALESLEHPYPRSVTPIYQLITRNRGSEEALTWLERRRSREPTEPRWTWILGRFHMEQGRPEQGLPLLEQTIRIISAEANIDLESDRQPPPVDSISGHRRSSLSLLTDVLRDLYPCAMEAREHDKAFRYATFGLTWHRELLASEGYHSPEIVTAGDVEARLIRGSVLVERGRLKAAEREIEQARVVAAEFPHPRWESIMAHACAKLRMARENSAE